MRIERIKVQNLIGIRSLDAALGSITLFAGLNWSGKTTLQQAVRLALCRELPRIKLKKHAAALVNDAAGKAGASVTIETDFGTYEASITKGGKIAFNTGPNREAIETILAGILEPAKFGSLDSTERRTYLCAALGIVATTERVTNALRSKGVADEAIESITPLLAGGTFEAAEAEAEARCKEGRAEWKRVTGEDYGTEKAAAWEAPELATDAEEARKALTKAEALEKLAAKELAEFSGKTQTARTALAKAEHAWKCVHCGEDNAPNETAAQEIRAVLPEYEKSLAFLTTAHQNRVRDCMLAATAAAEASSQDEIRKTKTKDATAANEKIALWLKVRDLMSPDGVPASLVADALVQMNNRMRDTSTTTGWPQVSIGNDMTITVGNRLYELCSEAEQWTADAAIAEALSKLTNTNLLMLDRVDVLGIERRNELLVWADELAGDGAQVILGATLKGPATIDGVTCYWIRQGEIQQAA